MSCATIMNANPQTLSAGTDLGTAVARLVELQVTSLPVVDGRLGIGRWQSVLLVELDGPRQREVLLQLIDTVGAPPLDAGVAAADGPS